MRYKSRLKRKQFAKHLIENDFNQADAYKKTFPTASDHTARVASSRLMQEKETQEEIEKRVAGITPDWIAARLEDLSASSKRDADKLRALELLGRWKKLSMFSDSTGNNQLNIITQSELDSIRSKLQVSSDTKETQHTIEADAKPLDCKDLGDKSV